MEVIQIRLCLKCLIIINQTMLFICKISAHCAYNSCGFRGCRINILFIFLFTYVLWRALSGGPYASNIFDRIHIDSIYITGSHGRHRQVSILGCFAIQLPDGVNCRWLWMIKPKTNMYSSSYFDSFIFCTPLLVEVAFRSRHLPS